MTLHHIFSLGPCQNTLTFICQAHTQLAHLCVVVISLDRFPKPCSKRLATFFLVVP